MGLILTDEEYDTITNTQHFDPPTHPPPLNIAATETAIQAFQLKENHAEAKSTYLECKTLKKQCLDMFNVP